MFFKEKLKLLTDLFKISNSQLARGINVDASLISRWKSGQRKISRNSPHIAAIAAYFIQLNAYQYQKEYLEQLIEAHLPAGQRNAEARQTLVLSAWLISDEPPHPIDPGKQPSQIAQSNQLIANIAQFLSNPRMSIDTMLAGKGDSKLKQVQQNLALRLAEIEQENKQTRKRLKKSTGSPDKYQDRSAGDAADHPDEDSSKMFSVEKYRGYAGRRQAVLLFLQEALLLTSPQKMYLLSEDNTDWMLEDPAFTYAWAALFRKVIEAGHDITIIHVVNREMTEIARMMQYWMPLHLSGNLRSYYMPRYNDKNIMETQFILAGHKALLSTTVKGNEKSSLMYAVSDLDLLDNFEEIFLEQLKQCNPLFSIYNPPAASRLFSDILKLQEQSGTVYNIHDNLNIITMPEKMFIQTASRNLDELPGGSWQSFYRKHRDSLEHQLETNRYIDIYPVQILDQIQRDGHAVCRSNELFMTEPGRLSRQETIIWLEMIIDLQVNYSNYHVYFSPKAAGMKNISVNITYKEFITALFSSNNRDQILVRIDEANILHALSYYFVDLIDQIPSSLKKKADVINRLQRLLLHLKNEDITRSVTKVPYAGG